MVATHNRLHSPLLGLALLFGAADALAHLDEGACLAVTEVVLDHVTMISGDETGGEEIRIYTNVSTVGHWKQESFFAFADDSNKGLTREQYDERRKDGEENPHGDQPIVGHTIYYHVNCIPHEPFNFTFEMWDDDSWDIEAILETIKEILDLPGMPVEAKLWGGIGVAIAELASKLSQGSRDNHSKFEVRARHYDNGQHTEPGSLVCCNDQGWKVGDHGSDFVFTVKKSSEGACTLENWEDTMADFLTQLRIEKNLEKKLQDAYENLLKKVRDREKKKEKREDVSRSEDRDTLKALDEAVADSRAQVDAVLVEVAEAWSGPEGTIPVRDFENLSKLKYWADETQAIDGMPLVAPEKAATCPHHGAMPAPRTAQISFSSIDAGDQVRVNPRYARGTATITFAAIEEEQPEPVAAVERDDDGLAVVTFAGVLVTGVHLLVSGDEGGALDITTGPTEPSIVSGGRGSFVFEEDADNPIVGVAVSDQAAPEARSDWVASLKRPDGSIESAYDVVGLPMEACNDGGIDFAIDHADGTSSEISHGAMCISYRMEQTTRVGETVPLQATIAGADPETQVRFTFSSNPAQVVIEPAMVTLTVGEINHGTPISGITSKIPGDHGFDVTVKLIEGE